MTNVECNYCKTIEHMSRMALEKDDFRRFFFFFFLIFLINFIGIILSYKSNKREVTRTKKKNCQKGVTNGT